MAKLLLSLLMVLCLSPIAMADEIPLGGEQLTGGGEPFGDKIDFPWENVEGCWKSSGKNPLIVKVQRQEQGTQKSIRIGVFTGDGSAFGTGLVKDRSVLAFLVGADGGSETKIFYSNLAAFCVKERKDAIPCEEALVISISKYNNLERSGETYVLGPASDENSCNFFN